MKLGSICCVLCIQSGSINSHSQAIGMVDLCMDFTNTDSANWEGKLAISHITNFE